MTIRRSGWIIAAIFPACWAAIIAAQVWGESDWAKVVIMPFVIIAFPGEVIAMLLTPIWIVLAAWRSFRKRHLSLVEGVCAIVLAGEVAMTLFGDLEGRFIK